MVVDAAASHRDKEQQPAAACTLGRPHCPVPQIKARCEMGVKILLLKLNI